MGVGRAVEGREHGGELKCCGYCVPSDMLSMSLQWLLRVPKEIEGTF
jgi:hypothetical protein